MANYSPECGSSEQVSPRVRRALAFIRSTYSDSTLRLEDVGRYVQLSPSYLTQLIKRETGQGFRAHLLAIRFAEARRLLLTTTLSVKEIAAAIGYDNTSSFDREFRRVQHCSPTEWKRALSRGAAS